MFRLSTLLVFMAAAGFAQSPCDQLKLSFPDATVTSIQFIPHTVTVSASSLYEAAILGIAEFKKSGFAFGGISGATRIKIAVEPPAITHELTLAKVQAWLETNGKTPREQARKVTLRQVLSRA
jgi:hypothetical protein